MIHHFVTKTVSGLQGGVASVTLLRGKNEKRFVLCVYINPWSFKDISCNRYLSTESPNINSSHYYNP